MLRIGNKTQKNYGTVRLSSLQLRSLERPNLKNSPLFVVDKHLPPWLRMSFMNGP